MKKVLFLIEDLKFGGAEVSLVNLLNSLDFENHNFPQFCLCGVTTMKLLIRLNRISI